LVSKVDLAIIGVAIVGLFFVIRGAGQALSNFKFPDLASTIGDIKFPDFSNVFGDVKFPDFQGFGEGASDFFSDLQKQFTDFFNSQKDISGEEFMQDGQPGMFGEETTFDKDTGKIEGETPPTVDLDVAPGGLDPLGEISFNKLKSQVFNTLTQTIGLTPAKAFAQLKDLEFTKGATILDLDKILQSFNQPIDPALLGQQAPAATVPAISNQPIQNFLDQPGQTFLGGGQGFIGGSINETPLQNLSLSSLIDKFGITASQAANLKAISANDFGGFDFGSNTGLGIGSIFKNPSLENILPSPSSNVSNPSFVGLSNTQIALQLTGGNIQNFA